MLNKNLISFRSQSKEDRETVGLHADVGALRDLSGQNTQLLGSARGANGGNGAGGQSQGGKPSAPQQSQL